MERLTKRNEQNTKYYYPKCFEKCGGNGNSANCNSCELEDMICEKLGRYEDLEEQGLILRIPYKVGGQLYYCNEEFEVVFLIQISTIHISDMGNGEKLFQFDGALYNSNGDVGLDYEFDLEDFGKTVFLTREEAEAALHMQGDTHD